MWLRITQVIGIGFLFVPITAAGYIGVPPEGNSVSGIIISCAISEAVSGLP
jgi:MFS transporter, DHA2 family, multidrug resistance protein